MDTTYLQLRGLFASRQPSVTRFKQAIRDLSPHKQEEWQRKAYFVAMNNWHILSVWYKTFLVNLVKNDWQRFMDYTRDTSVVGHLAYPVEDTHFVRKVFGLLARLPVREGESASGNHIAFVFALGFTPKRKIRYIAHQIGKGLMTPEELTDLKELAIVDC